MLRILGVLWVLVGMASAAEPPVRGVFNADTGLHRYAGCTLDPQDWADGDSFSVMFPDRKAYTIRLYAVDCMETSGKEETDARRLRAQRRYFGITGFGGNARASNDKAKELGRLAKAKVQEILKGPFTVHTGWADGRGSAEFKRYYGFVTTPDGRDLAEVLVEAGLARAYGVYRRGPTGTSAQASRERLRDLELQAAVRRAGTWAHTDWDQLPVERQAARDELAELEAAKDKRGDPAVKVDPNSSTRDELMSLPGIGETKALAIIEGRTQGKYRQPGDLQRISGIGPQTIEKLKPFLRFGP